MTHMEATGGSEGDTARVTVSHGMVDVKLLCFR